MTPKKATKLEIVVTVRYRDDKYNLIGSSVTKSVQYDIHKALPIIAEMWDKLSTAAMHNITGTTAFTVRAQRALVAHKIIAKVRDLFEL